VRKLRARITVSLLLVAAVAACAPRPAYRQTEVVPADGGEDDGRAVDPPPPFGPPADAAAPDRPSDQGSPDEPAPADRPAPPGADAADAAGDAPPGVRTALLLVATPNALPADDAKLKARLEMKGFVVTVGDDDGMATQATGKDLVVISGSVASATLGTKYQNTTAAVICLEAFVFGSMKMTGPTRDTDFGQTNGTQISVVLDTHAIAAGQPRGNLTVASATTSLGWGTAAATADRIATLVGMATRDTAFAYDVGQMMVGMAAPGRRVGLFPTAPTPDRLNMAGWQIFDAAVDWATRP
jgi:hypothetical protein